MEPISLENKRRAKTACSTISAAVKCFLKPILQARSERKNSVVRNVLINLLWHVEYARWNNYM